MNQATTRHLPGGVEADLRRTKEMLEQTNRMARVGGWELDLHDNTLYWSEITKEIHGVPADFEPKLETGIDFYKKGASRDKITEVVARAIEQGTPYDVELQLVTSKGRDIWVRAIGNAEFRDGQCVRLFGTFQDIDERKKYEEELARAREFADLANRSKSEFLANMSHEIRTPMSAILGLAELVLETELTPTQQSYMEKLHSSSSSLLNILNDILDVSKIEANQLIVESRALAISDVPNRVSALFEDVCRRRSLELSFEVAKAVPTKIVGDLDRICQVLINLVSNAVKFTEEGRIAVAITVAERLEESLTLRFTVEDTGIGISPEKIGDLFQPFSQADPSSTRKFGGAGLGLSISKQLVNLMGGSIDVSSEPGVGSTFSFTLRSQMVLPPTEPADQVARSRNRLESAEPIHGARILLVEDNDVNQLVAAKFLRSAGLTVVVASHGGEAVRRVQEEPFDAVLMDAQMPIMDGFEATRRIRGLPGKQHLPIIATTAASMQGDREACLEAGMNDYISKPVDWTVVIERLTHWVKQPW